MTIVYLDGSFMDAREARISPMDRAFLFADGVYEVVPVFDGKPLGLHEHLRRLTRSLDALHIAKPLPDEQLAGLFLEMIQRNSGGNLAIYLQITRGAADKRDHAFPSQPIAPTVFMMASSLPATAVDDLENARGAKAITAQDIRWLRCDIKSVSLLPNVLMRQQAVEAGATETIMIRDGLVTEGSSTNVFIVKRGRAMTPPLSPRILGGITREIVLGICRERGLPMFEREIEAAELAAADEVWITSSTKDVLPIVTLDAAPVGGGLPGPVWKSLAQHFREVKRRE